MKLKWRLIPLVTALIFYSATGGCAQDSESTYRVLESTGVCLPCGDEAYVVIDSEDKVRDLHADMQEGCPDAQSAETWRQAVNDLGIDFEHEAIVAMYEVIGTGGNPSLAVTGPEEGVLRAAIAWETGPPPHVPIATAACVIFAVNKSAVHTVTITRGGVLNRNKSGEDMTNEELTLTVSRPPADR